LLVYVANNKIDGAKLVHICRETTSVYKRGGGGDEANTAMLGTESGIVLSCETKASTKYGTVEKKRG
jgi:hypothetical protein